MNFLSILILNVTLVIENLIYIFIKNKINIIIVQIFATILYNNFIYLIIAVD